MGVNGIKFAGKTESTMPLGEDQKNLAKCFKVGALDDDASILGLFQSFCYKGKKKY